MKFHCIAFGGSSTGEGVLKKSLEDVHCCLAGAGSHLSSLNVTRCQLHDVATDLCICKSSGCIHCCTYAIFCFVYIFSWKLRNAQVSNCQFLHEDSTHVAFCATFFASDTCPFMVTDAQAGLAMRGQ